MLLALCIVVLLFMVGAIVLSCMSDGKFGPEGAQLENAGCGLGCAGFLVLGVIVVLITTGVIA